MSNNKRVVIYIIPVTILSFIFNIPKFMEVTTSENNGTNEVVPSETRRDPTFIFWYTLSLIWHPTLTTGVLPFIGLVYMNLKIFIGIRRTRTVSLKLHDTKVIFRQRQILIAQLEYKNSKLICIHRRVHSLCVTQ